MNFVRGILRKILLAVAIAAGSVALSLSASPVNTTTFPGAGNGLPAGMVVDPSANFGIFAFMNNASLLSQYSLVAIPTSAASTITLTAAQFLNSIIDATNTGGAAFALQTPTAAQIVAAIPATLPKTGFNFVQLVMNDGSGQTMTYVAGTSVVLSATTATLSSNTSRLFLVNVNVNTSTVTIVGIGGGMTL